MAAVVDHDVDPRHLLDEPTPEVRVGLVADEDLDAFGLMRLTFGGDVDAVDAAVLPEVAAPHRQAAAAVDTDLNDVDRPANELGEVAVVDREIVRPLEDPGAFGHPVEVLLQR